MRITHKGPVPPAHKCKAVIATPPAGKFKTMPNENESESGQLEGLNQNDLPYLVAIMQGLLASGHYTNRETTEGDDEAEIRRYDNGPHWAENGYTRPRDAMVVYDAMIILEELKEELPLRIEVNKER